MKHAFEREKEPHKAKKVIYESDLKSILKLRKKLTRQWFSYTLQKERLVSTSFKLNQIKGQNLPIFMRFIELLGFSADLQHFSLSVLSYKIEKAQFIELLRKIFDLNITKSLQFSAPNLIYPKEIMGYFTKYLIMSLRHLQSLELDFSGNNFGDDGILIFGLGIVNLKLLETLKLNFKGSKMKGIGLINLLTNMKGLKQMKSFALNCEGVNKVQEDFNKNYLVILKLMKAFSSLYSIDLNFADNHLKPECIVKTLILFLKNSYFDNLKNISLNLMKNCKSQSWKEFESHQPTFLSKKRNEKYLDFLELSLKANSIEDHTFRYFYDILIYYKGLRSVVFDLSENKIKHFRSNIFFIFGAFAHNLTLERIVLDLTGSHALPFQNFSINGDHIPLLENMTSLTIKSRLPCIPKIGEIFADFLGKFPNLEKLHFNIPEIDALSNENLLRVIQSIGKLKNLKTLILELLFRNLLKNDFFNIIQQLTNLQNLETVNLGFKSKYNNHLQDNLPIIQSLKSNWRNLFHLRLATQKEHKDAKFLKDLKSLATLLLEQQVFLIVDEYEEISGIFYKKKALVMISWVLTVKLRSVFKRIQIIAEILGSFV